MRNKKYEFSSLEKDFLNTFIFPRSLFNDFAKSTKQTTGFPVYDIFRENDKTTLQYALAGYSVDQLSVTIEGTVLTIAADRRGEGKEGSRIASRSFKSSFEAKGFSLDKIEVSFINGILEIVIPKEEPKKVEIKKFNILTE